MRDGNELRDELITNIKVGINKLRTTGEYTVKAKESIANSIREYIPAGMVIRIVDGDYEISQLQNGQLYLIAKAFKEYDPIKFNYDLEKYFDEKDRDSAYGKTHEMSKILQIKCLEKGTEDKPEWIGVLSYQEIYEIYSNGLLRYNMNTQRVPNVYIQNGTQYLVADIDGYAVKSIAKAIDEERFETNTITLNILKTEESIKLPYKDFVLEIDTEKNNIDIIDGVHRILGICDAVSKRNKEIENGENVKPLEGIMSVCIKNLSEEEAQNFIYQESLANLQAHKTKMVYASDSSIATYFNKLNTDKKSSNFALYDRFGSKSSQVSIQFLYAFLDDFYMLEKLNKLVENGRSLNDLVADTKTTFQIIYNDLGKTDVKKATEEYKKNENIYEHACFYAGCFLWYISTKKKDTDITNEEVQAFTERIKGITDKSLFIYDYPFSGVNKTKKRNFVKNLFLGQ